MNIQEFVDKNRPSAVKVTAEQIQKAARECGFEIEYPSPAKEGWFGRLFHQKEQPKPFKFKIVAKEGAYEFFKKPMVLTYIKYVNTKEGVVQYEARCEGAGGTCSVLERVLQQAGIATPIRVALPEPVVKYPFDARDGAPKKETLLFLSRARELARGDEKLEAVFQSPTGEILWEKYEDCWVCCNNWWCSDPVGSREEAEKVHAGSNGCYCNDITTGVRAFTLVYGEKVYL